MPFAITGDGTKGRTACAVFGERLHSLHAFLFFYVPHTRSKLFPDPAHALPKPRRAFAEALPLPLASTTRSPPLLRPPRVQGAHNERRTYGWQARLRQSFGEASANFRLAMDKAWARHQDFVIASSAVEGGGRSFFPLERAKNGDAVEEGVCE